MSDTATTATGQKNSAIKPDRVLRDTVIVVAARLMGGAGMLALNVLVARYLPPATYGAFALSVTVLILMDSLVGSAVDLGVLRLSTEKSHDSEFLSGYEMAGGAIKLLLAGGMLVIAVLWGHQIETLLFSGEGGSRLPAALALASGAILLFRAIQVHWQVKQKFVRHASAEIAHLFLRFALVGGALLYGVREPWLLIGAYAVSSIAMTGLLLVGPWAPGIRLGNLNRQIFGETVRRGWDAMRVFGVGALASRAEYFALAATRQPVQLGIYGAAQVLAAAPELVASYSSTVLSPRILPGIRDGSFRRLFVQVSLAGFAVAAVGLVAGILLAGPVIRALLPPDYHVAIPVVKILIPGYLATGMLFPLTLSFLVFKKPKIFLLYDALSLPVLAVSYYFAGIHFGAVGVAWLSSASRVIKFIVIQSLAWKLVSDLSRPVGSPQDGDHVK